MGGFHRPDRTALDHHHGPGHHYDHVHGPGHHHDHSAHHHDHHHDGGHGGHRQIFYPRPHARSRRAFLGNFGKGMAMAVITPAALAACASDDTSSVSTESTEPTAAPTSAPTAAPEAAEDTSSADPTAAPEAEPTAEQAAEAAADPGSSDLVWARSNLGFVSAYVLVRGNSAAIVDTGTAGSATAIGETLRELGLNYADVAHVILTHNHGDHAGSITEVLAEAVNATAYAGEADLGPLPADLTGLVGGEDIFGFEMVPTPGHTPGHMVAFDSQAGLLIAGDAIFTEGGGVVEGPPRFFDDVAQSRESIKAMADLTFNTLLVGHGDPIESGADAAVAALAASF